MHSTNTFTWRIYIIFVCSKYTIHWGMLKILHIQGTQFFKKICAFNEIYYLKNIHNFVCSMYAIYWRTLEIFHVQQTQFFHNFAHFNDFKTHRIYIITYIWTIQLLEECSSFACLTSTIFLKKLHIQQTLWLKQFT